MSRATSIFSTAARAAKTPTPTTVNRDGYPAYERPLLEQAVQTLTTNTLGNTFYVSQKDLVKEADQILDAALKEDPEFLSKAIVYARNKGYMRTVPQFALAKLAATKEDYFSEIFSQVIKTPKDLSDFTLMLKSLRGGEGGRRVKRVAAKWLVDKLTPYWTIKYGADKGKGAYSLTDLVKTYHPNFGGFNPLVAYLFGKELPEGVDFGTQVEAFEKLKRATTDEEKARAIADGRLPHEVVTPFIGASPKLWNDLVPQMPYLALLKNLATLERHGVLTERQPQPDVIRQLVTKTLTNQEAIAKAMVLPYTFLNAMEKVQVSWVKDVLRQALELSFVAIPEIPGRTAIFLDISGSMSGSFLKIASIFAIGLAKKTQGDVRFLTFDTNAYDVNVSLQDSILSQAEKIHVRGGTNTAAPLQKITAERDKVDNIILITDEQQNTGRGFLSVLNEYKERVNRNVKTFVVDVSPYRSAVAPSSEKNVYFIYGWSNEVLGFISLTSQGFGSVVDAIRNGAA